MSWCMDPEYQLPCIRDHTGKCTFHMIEAINIQTENCNQATVNFDNFEKLCVGIVMIVEIVVAIVVK